MALDAAHRASIYEKLRPVLGDENANVLMSEFPSVEAQELVTKDFLRAELATLGGELRVEMAGLRTDMAELKTALTVRIGAAIAACTALQLTALGVLT
jgi:hypothetical protein